MVKLVQSLGIEYDTSTEAVSRPNELSLLNIEPRAGFLITFWPQAG